MIQNKHAQKFASVPRFFSLQLDLNLPETCDFIHWLQTYLYLSTVCVIAVMAHLVSAWRLLTFPWPAVNEHKCSAEVFTILTSKT